MAMSSSILTQSEFYSPAFNSAIFDGPFRIYFAQFQEDEALKVYFQIHNHFKEILENSAPHFQKYNKNIFILIYPTEKCLLRAFQSKKIKIYEASIDTCPSFGFLCSSAPNLMEELLDRLKKIMLSDIQKIKSTLDSSKHNNFTL